MIVTDVFYAIKCNRCGEIHSDGEHSYWADESSAEEQAMESEWLEEKGRHYCPNCYDQNEEDDKQTIKPEFPDYLKNIRKFLTYNILGYCNEVTENEDVYIITKSLHNRQHLEPFEEDYIKNIAKEFFVSIEYKRPERYTRNDAIIVLKK